jgi:hypothetical protein
MRAREKETILRALGEIFSRASVNSTVFNSSPMVSMKVPYLFRESDVKQGFQRLHVLCYHLPDVAQVGKFGQGRHERDTWGFKFERATDTYSQLHTSHAKPDNFEVLGILSRKLSHASSRQPLSNMLVPCSMSPGCLSFLACLLRCRIPSTSKLNMEPTCWTEVAGMKRERASLTAVFRCARIRLR